VGASLKINVVFLAVAAIVAELFTVVSTPFLENVARAEVLQKARIMMEGAAGIRTYTSNEIAPLLNGRTDGEIFHAQTIPAYAATKNFALLASKFRDYAYREAALNPMSSANRAVDWEADIINTFRRNPEIRELVTERETGQRAPAPLVTPYCQRGPVPRVSREGRECSACVNFGVWDREWFRLEGQRDHWRSNSLGPYGSSVRRCGEDPKFVRGRVGRSLSDISTCETALAA
jgi:hypothetical protein